jgi:hypothetical protein
MKFLTAMALMAALGISGVVRSEVPMEKVATGERSGIAEARTVVVRDEVAWQALWNEVAIRKPIPTIDFAKRMLVGVFLGTRPTSGFSVQIVEVRDEQGVLVVRYSEHRPSPRAMVRQVLTAPFVIVSVPPDAGRVRFEAVTALPPGLVR